MRLCACVEEKEKEKEEKKEKSTEGNFLLREKHQRNLSPKKGERKVWKETSLSKEHFKGCGGKGGKVERSLGLET